MNVLEIYKKYNIVPNLQTHMLRVASVAAVITDKWKLSNVDQNAVIDACLFHDAGKIVKFSFSDNDPFKDELGDLDFWRKLKNVFTNKYGKDEHSATINLCKEIGIQKRVINIIDNLDWNNIKKVLKKDDYNSAIAIYSDMRVGPNGIMSFQDRLINLRNRVGLDDFDSIQTDGLQLELKLQMIVQMNLEDINDNIINERIEQLKSRDIALIN